MKSNNFGWSSSYKMLFNYCKLKLFIGSLCVGIFFCIVIFFVLVLLDLLKVLEDFCLLVIFFYRIWSYIFFLKFVFISYDCKEYGLLWKLEERGLFFGYLVFEGLGMLFWKGKCVMVEFVVVYLLEIIIVEDLCFFLCGLYWSGMFVCVDVVFFFFWWF